MEAKASVANLSSQGHGEQTQGLPGLQTDRKSATQDKAGGCPWPGCFRPCRGVSLTHQPHFLRKLSGQFHGRQNCQLAWILTLFYGSFHGFLQLLNSVYKFGN